MKAVLRFWRMPWSTLAGACIGILLVLGTPDIVAPVRDAYDALRPVLRMQGQLVSRDADGVLLHIHGTKLRGEECRIVAVYGYARQRGGSLTDAVATRVNGPQDKRPREQGQYDIGLWRVAPLGPDPVGAKVVAHHECVGRVILSTIAEVAF
jgi:hypothetical protein